MFQRAFRPVLIGAALAASLALGLAGGEADALTLALVGGLALASQAERRDGDAAETRSAEEHGVEERQEGAWHVYPLEGVLQLAYRDVAGNPSIRRVFARELKVGPGKLLLGGIDAADDGYRGFRADRIEYLVDAETGRTINRNIVDWLIKRAQAQARERRKVRA